MNFNFNPEKRLSEMNNQKIQNMFEFPDAKSIVVSGDIHGDFTQLVYKCCIHGVLYNMLDCMELREVRP